MALKFYLFYQLSIETKLTKIWVEELNWTKSFSTGTSNILWPANNYLWVHTTYSNS